MTARRMNGNGTASYYHGVEHEEIWSCDSYPKCQPVEPVTPKAGEATPSKPWLKWNVATLRKRYGELTDDLATKTIELECTADYFKRRVDSLTAELETAKTLMEVGSKKYVALMDERDALRVELEKTEAALKTRIRLSKGWEEALDQSDRLTAKLEKANQLLPVCADLRVQLAGAKGERDALRVELDMARFNLNDALSRKPFWTPWRVFWAVAIPVTVVVCVGLWAGWWR